MKEAYKLLSDSKPPSREPRKAKQPKVEPKAAFKPEEKEAEVIGKPEPETQREPEPRDMEAEVVGKGSQQPDTEATDAMLLVAGRTQDFVRGILEEVILEHSDRDAERLAAVVLGNVDQMLKHSLDAFEARTECKERAAK